MALKLRRQTIREHTVAILQAAGTAAGDRVYPTPILPWRRERPLPAIGVYTLEERGVAPDGKGVNGPFQLTQSLQLVLDVIVELPTDPSQDQEERLSLDTQAPLDELCAQITLALLTNPAWYNPNRKPPPLFDGLQSRTTHGVPGPVDKTDRRTMAARITHVLLYGCVAEPLLVDPWEPPGTEPPGVTPLLRLSFFDVDVIDPAADPNIRYPGPDGRIEVRFKAPGPKDPPLWPDPLNGGSHAG